MPKISLDEAIKIFKLPKPTRLKLDVDGEEFNILKGATEALKSVRDLTVEISMDKELIFAYLERNFKFIEQQTIGSDNLGIFNYYWRRK